MVEFFEYDFELLGLERGEEERLESGAIGIEEARPEIGELTADKDGKHGLRLKEWKGLEEITLLKCQGVEVRLLQRLKRDSM